jgi:integrase
VGRRLVRREAAALDAPSSWLRYRDLLDHHVLPTLGRLRLTAIRPPQVLAWRDWMRSAHGPLKRPSSAVEIRRAEALLRQIIKAAGAREYVVAESIFKMVHVKARHAKRPGLDAAQFLALVAASGEPWRTMYVVAYYAMTRDGETRGLTWERVLWASNQVDVAQQIDRAGTVRAPKHGSPAWSTCRPRPSPSSPPTGCGSRPSSAARSARTSSSSPATVARSTRRPP